MINDPNTISVRNRSGEKIPPFAVMEIDYRYTSNNCAVEDGDNSRYFNVKKPTASCYCKPERLLINGPLEIAIGGYGEAVSASGTMIALVKNGSVVKGSMVGPKDSSWYLELDQPGFIVRSLDDASKPAFSDANAKSMFVLALGREPIVCQTPGGGIGAKSGSNVVFATCLIFVRAGTLIGNPSVNATVEVCNLSTTSIGGGVLIIAVPSSIGYVADWEDC